MTSVLDGMTEGAKWNLMVGAARRGAEEAGYQLSRLPGRGLSNMWNLTKDGAVKVTSIRTTRDRWIAFPPMENGTKWKTLDDADLVLVAAVDNKENPQRVEVYLFDASEVRARFDAAYAARTQGGHVVRDNFGMWVNLDLDQRGIPASVGSGLAHHQQPIAVFALASLVDSGAAGEVTDLEPESEGPHDPPSAEEEAPLTIADAKRRLARTLGVDPSSIKITVEA